VSSDALVNRPTARGPACQTRAATRHRPRASPRSPWWWHLNLNTDVSVRVLYPAVPRRLPTHLLACQRRAPARTRALRAPCVALFAPESRRRSAPRVRAPCRVPGQRYRIC
jgi:hypothetical protein